MFVVFQLIVLTDVSSVCYAGTWCICTIGSLYYPKYIAVHFYLIFLVLEILIQ